MKMISIAQDFSKFPFGRTADHGPFNGARFRDQYLKPALSANDALTVSLDGARGLSPSFLEEAFGGLVRAGFGADYLRQHITIQSKEDPTFIDEIWQYVDDAATGSRRER